MLGVPFESFLWPLPSPSSTVKMLTSVGGASARVSNGFVNNRAYLGPRSSAHLRKAEWSIVSSPRPVRLSVILLACLLGLAACKDFTLEPAKTTPVVTDIVPRAAFGDSVIELVGEAFDPTPANNEVTFANGASVRAVGGNSERIQVVVPRALQETGPVTVSTATARSAPSAVQFVPLGWGHPNQGSLVAEVRFRHRPVGLLDSTTSVVMTSTLFDLLVTDYGDSVRLDGRPVAFARAPGGPDALVSIKSRDGRGQLLEADGTNGRIQASSASSKRVEKVIVAGGAGPARTLGIDPYGNWFLSTWERTGSTLAATQTRLEVIEVTGAVAAPDGTVLAVATVADQGGPKTVLARIAPDGKLERLWTPDSDGHTPTGPIALAQTTDPVVVLGLADGDLGFVNLTTRVFHHELMVSYGLVGGISAGVTPEKIVFTKPSDGAVLQFDVARYRVDWSVQLRGEPTVLDVAADLGEVAVGNVEENVVDIIAAASGTWLGRISFNLGLGSADDGDGGAVAPYSYDPAAPSRPPEMLVLARSARMVLKLDPSSLDVAEPVHLAEGSSEPQRLLATSDLRALVVHRRELGLIEVDGERLVASNLTTPVAVAALADGSVALGNAGSIDVLEWRNEELVRAGGVSLPDGSSLAALNSFGSQVLVLWSASGGYGGGIWTAEALRSGGAAKQTLSLPSSLGELMGLALLADGPAALFAQSSLGGPAILTFAELQAGGAHPLPSAMSSPLLGRATPDGRYLAWLSEEFGEHSVRLLYFDPRAGLASYSNYRLPGNASGLTFDPSGQWMYIPVPKLDLVTVVQ